MKTNSKVTIVDVVNHAKSVFRYLLRKWVIIVGVGISFGLIAITYIWLKKPVYIAEMSFVTETESKSSISAYAGIAAQFGIDLGGSGSNSLFEGDNLIELFKSRHLIIQTLLSKSDETSSRLLINDYLKIQNEENGDVAKMNFALFGKNFDRKRDSIIKKVAKQIMEDALTIAKRDKKLSIIDLRMKSSDEIFAKKFTELLAVNAIQYYTEYKIKKSTQNVAIIKRQTDSVRTILYGNIGDMASINDLNVNPTRQIVRTSSQRKQVDLQANSALYVELVKNLELSRLSLRKETPLIQIVDTPILPLERKGIGRLLAGIIGACIGSTLAVIVLLFGFWYSKIKEDIQIRQKIELL